MSAVWTERVRRGHGQAARLSCKALQRLRTNGCSAGHADPGQFHFISSRHLSGWRLRAGATKALDVERASTSIIPAAAGSNGAAVTSTVSADCMGVPAKAVSIPEGGEFQPERLGWSGPSIFAFDAFLRDAKAFHVLCPMRIVRRSEACKQETQCFGDDHVEFIRVFEDACRRRPRRSTQ